MSLGLPPRFSYHVVRLYYILLPILLMIYNILVFLGSSIVGLYMIWNPLFIWLRNFWLTFNFLILLPDEDIIHAILWWLFATWFSMNHRFYHLWILVFSIAHNFNWLYNLQKIRAILYLIKTYSLNVREYLLLSCSCLSNNLYINLHIDGNMHIKRRFYKNFSFKAYKTKQSIEFLI